MAAISSLLRAVTACTIEELMAPEVGVASVYWPEVGLLAICSEEVVPLIAVPLIGML
jgi:hypothetical protein